MSDDQTWAVSLAVMVVAFMAGVSTIVHINSGNGTERERVCVQSGGSYVKAENDT